MHIPTGYVVTNDVLREYAQSGEVPTLRRAESYGRKVVYYFDYVSLNLCLFAEMPLPLPDRGHSPLSFQLEASARTCVKTRLDRWFPVANMTIQHTMKVYDYYEPGWDHFVLGSISIQSFFQEI